MLLYLALQNLQHKNILTLLITLLYGLSIARYIIVHLMLKKTIKFYYYL